MIRRRWRQPTRILWRSERRSTVRESLLLRVRVTLLLLVRLTVLLCETLSLLLPHARCDQLHGRPQHGSGPLGDTHVSGQTRMTPLQGTPSHLQMMFEKGNQ
jgi:hypothetical protein